MHAYFQQHVEGLSIEETYFETTVITVQLMEHPTSMQEVMSSNPASNFFVVILLETHFESSTFSSLFKVRIDMEF